MTYSKFVFFLIVSIFLHLAVLAVWLAVPMATQKNEVIRPITVNMRAFALNKAPVAPVQTPPASKTPQSSTSSIPKVKKNAAIQSEKPKAKKAVPKKSKKAEEIKETLPIKEAEIKEKKIVNAVALAQDTLDATDPAAWEKLSQAALPENPLQQDLTLNDEKAPPKQVTNIQVKHPYDIIAPAEGEKPPFPKDAFLRYQGPLSLTGTMHFQRSADSYHIEAVFNIPFNKMTFISEGKIEGNTLIPLRYIHKRKGKIYASAVFDYQQKITHYGKGEEPSKQYPMQGLQLDYFSWAWQMSINGGVIDKDVQITNGKKAYLQPAMNPNELIGEESQLDTGEGKIRLITLHINREQAQKTDSIGYGFAPDFANIPAKIMFDNGKDQYELNIFAITLDGQKYWQAMRRVSKRKY